MWKRRIFFFLQQPHPSLVVVSVLLLIYLFHFWPSLALRLGIGGLAFSEQKGVLRAHSLVRNVSRHVCVLVRTYTGTIHWSLAFLSFWRVNRIVIPVRVCELTKKRGR